MRRDSLARLLALVLVAGLCGCGDEPSITPRSQASPSALATARSCVVGLLGVEALVAPERCEEGGDLAGGVVQTLELVGSRERQSVALIAMDLSIPVLIDVDRGVPGVTGIAACDSPLRMATSPEGAFALVLCDVERSLAVLAISNRREVMREPRDELEVDLVALAGQPLFALAQPEAQSVVIERLAFDCDGMTDAFPRGCDPEVELTREATIAMPGRPEYLVAAEDGGFFVAYQDRSFISRFDLDEQSAECLDAGAAAPCETLRVGIGPECSDGVDNDGDGRIDRADLQCFGPDDAESPDSPRGRLTECTDGLDNDGDGTIDHNDVDCLSAIDDSEGGGVRAVACADGLDNDRDGLVDDADPECVSETWDSEERFPRCGDGLDNDADGDIDPDDEDCLGEEWDSEAPVPDGAGECSNGLDDDGDGFADLADPGCNDPFDEGELGPAPVCADGADNDGDGAVDWADPDCYGRAGGTELGFAPDGLGPIGLDATFRFLTVASQVRKDVAIVDLETGRFVDTGADSYLHPGYGVRVTSGGLIARHAAWQRRGLVTDTAEVRSGVEDIIAMTPTTDGFATILDLLHVVFVERGAQRDEGVELRLRPLDNNSRFAESGALGCEVPDAYRDRIRESRPPGSELGIGCDDEEVPHLAPVVEEELVFLRREERFDLVQDEVVTEQVPFDWQLRTEDWALVFEGIVPGAERDDGLVDAEIPGLLVSAGANFCNLGIEPGDRVIIEEVSPSLTVLPEDCADLVAVERLAYRVDYVRSDSLVLGVTGVEGEPTRLPDRDCFSSAFSYVVRASDEWLAVGAASELIHDWEPLSKQCVLQTGDELIRGRFAADEPFENVYFSLLVESGTVAPLEDMTIQFAISNNFSVAALETGPTPMDIDVVTSLAGRRVVISDGGLSAVYIFNAEALSPIVTLQ